MRKGKIVRSFRFGEAFFHHINFPSADSIELCDEYGETVLSFDSGTVIRDGNGVVGQVSLETIDGAERWVLYENPLRTRTILNSPQLIDAEVEISKRYLSRQPAVEQTIHYPATAMRVTQWQSPNYTEGHSS